MSYDAPLERASFWRETLLPLKRTIQLQWRWVLGLALAMAAAQFVIYGKFDQKALESQISNDPKDAAKNLAVMAKMWGYMGRAFVAQAMLYAVAVYVSTSLFLQREAISSPPQMSLGNFLYWFFKGCQRYLIVLLPILLLGVAFGVLGALQISQPVTKLVAPILLAATIVFCLFLTYRLSLITPLAVLRREPVLRTSWQITEGQCWRIWWGFFVLSLIVLPVFLIPYAGSVIAAEQWGDISIGARLLSAVAQGVWGAVIATASAVYYCTVYRILLHEPRNNPITVT